MDTPKISVLILGASGGPGGLITKYCLKQGNFIVNVQVRNPDQIKDLVPEIEKSGGKVIKSDLNDSETVVGITEGIHTVISCIRAFGDAEVTCQTNVLNDALKHGVKRFFPSRFGMNHEYAPKDNVAIKAKLDFDKHLLAQDKIRPVIISCGAFTDFLLDFYKNGVTYWGDIDQKIDTITYDDIARFTVAVASKPELSGHFTFVGEQLSVRQIVDTYNRVRGTSVEAKKSGSIEELKKLAEEKKKDNLFEATYLQLFALMYSGAGNSSSTNNKDFPEVRVTPLEEVFKQKPELKLA